MAPARQHRPRSRHRRRSYRRDRADDRDPLDDDETALVEYAVAVVRGEVNAVVHDEVAARYDDETIVGIAAAASGYEALGGVIDAFDLELESGTEFHGWDPR